MYSKFTLNIYRMTDDPLEIVRTGEPFSSLGFRRTRRRSSAEVGGLTASTVSPRTDRIRQKRRPRCPTGQATTGTLHSSGGGKGGSAGRCWSYLVS